MVTKLPDEDLIKLHAAGVTKPDIAQYYGLSRLEGIRKRERKLGLAPRPPGCRPLGTPSVEDVLNDRAPTHQPKEKQNGRDQSLPDAHSAQG